MKKSITRKIIVSYIVIVCASMIFVGVFYNFALRRYMEKQAIDIMQDDARTISEAFKSQIKNESEAKESTIAQIIRERMKGIKTLDSSFAIINKNFGIIYPKTGNEAAEFKNQVLPQLAKKVARIKRNSRRNPGAASVVRVLKDKEENVVILYPLDSKIMGKAASGWVVLYTSIGPIKNLRSGMMYILLISMAFTGALSVIFGILFARSIAKPVILLKNKAQALAKRNFDGYVDVRTGDELEELANTVNRMAAELKEYDVAQKRFLQNASHELKTPLMSIQGYAEGIKDGIFDDEHQALDVIVEESTRLKGIVEELIYLSKLETMKDFYKYGHEHINQIVEKSVEKLNGLAAKKNIVISMTLHQDVMLTLDRDKLLQAFINIIGNCLRYANSMIKIATEIGAHNIEIVIADDGEGFEEEDICNIFERFWKGKKGNTGLGLAITKVIIEKHGGSIEAANGKAGGAEFKITLPIK